MYATQLVELWAKFDQDRSPIFALFMAVADPMPDAHYPNIIWSIFFSSDCSAFRILDRVTRWRGQYRLNIKDTYS
ncbi:hypothetical protein A8H39_10870 [Paraburkholderia fungorum]|nr:hypothetical protein A8H39_10870 [Paraburkholderia fungorum]